MIIVFPILFNFLRISGTGITKKQLIQLISSELTTGIYFFMCIRTEFKMEREAKILKHQGGHFTGLKPLESIRQKNMKAEYPTSHIFKVPMLICICNNYSVPITTKPRTENYLKHHITI